jgi:hypothetical protein
MRIGRLLLGAVWLAGSAAAQPASDLLQSGIYNQETTGDLDAAIRFYRQILNAGASQRLYAAQAQFHLGECLLRKGDTAGAIEAFQAVIRNYPAELDLVARAREVMPRGEGLLPAPWKEYEVAEYRWTIPGVDDAWSISYMGPSPKGSAFARIHGHYYSPGVHSFDVDVERDTMRPVLASYSAASSRTGPPGGSGYEYGELVYLLRRMPLSTGWQTAIAVMLQDGTRVDLKVAVDCVEDVVVPAGTFRCFRVRLSAPRTHSSVLDGNWRVAADAETLWYGTDSGRQLVKMESGGWKGELTGIRTAEPAGQTIFRDPGLGLSFVVPSGWLQHSRAGSDAALTVDLIDPETQIWASATARAQGTYPAWVLPTLRATAAARLRRVTLTEHDYTVRGEMLEGTLGGHPTLYWIADFTSGGKKWVEYVTCAESQSAIATIWVRAPADEFDKLRPRFQPIVDSFRMR